MQFIIDRFTKRIHLFLKTKDQYNSYRPNKTYEKEYNQTNGGSHCDPDGLNISLCGG